MALNPPVSAARRGGHRPAAALAALAAALLSLVAAAGAWASAGAVVHLGSRTVTVPAGVITAGDVPPTVYTVAGSKVTLHGMSINALLTYAGATPGTVSSVTVGSAGPLSPVDIGDPPPFPEGPALISINNGTTRFLRPASAPGAGDAEYITTPAGLPIDVFVTGGAQQSAAAPSAALRVTAEAAPTVASVGESVSFTALVDNPPATGEQLNYSWSFGDGASSFQIAPNHSYAANGDYPATVTVSAGQGSSGVSSIVVVHVGHPQRTATGTGLGTTNATGTGAGGQGSGKGGTGGGAGTGGKGATQPRAQAKPAAKQPAQTPRPVGAAAKSAAPRAAATSQPVTGVLLADAGSPLDLRLSPPPPSGSPGAAHKSAGGSSGIGAVIAGIALALVIATLGAVAERRRATFRPA